MLLTWKVEKEKLSGIFLNVVMFAIEFYLEKSI